MSHAFAVRARHVLAKRVIAAARIWPVYREGSGHHCVICAQLLAGFSAFDENRPPSVHGDLYAACTDGAQMLTFQVGAVPVAGVEDMIKGEWRTFLCAEGFLE